MASDAMQFYAGEVYHVDEDFCGEVYYDVYDINGKFLSTCSYDFLDEFFTFLPSVLEYTKINALYMCNVTHTYGTNRYYLGKLYSVSEIYFNTYYYYEISDMDNKFIGSIGEIYFHQNFVDVDKCIFELDELFNNIMNGDIVFI